MFVAKEQETHLEAQSGALYAPPTPAFAKTKSRETIHNMSFGPKGVDWACSLRKNKKHIWKNKVVHCMLPQHPLSEGIARNHPKHEFWA